MAKARATDPHRGGPINASPEGFGSTPSKSQSAFSIASLFLLWVPVFLFSCGNGNNKNEILPDHIGESGEVVVVMPDHLWESTLGDTLLHYLEASQPGLPQPEPQFSVNHFPPRKLNDLIKKHRNIIYFSTEEEQSDPDKEFHINENVWAKGQLMLRIRGENGEALKKAFLGNKDRIIGKINERERKRAQKPLKASKDRSIQDTLRKDHGLSIALPNDTRILENHDATIWLEKHEMRSKGNFDHDVIQGVIISYYPYRKKSDLDPETLLDVRDSILKTHIEGPQKGSYMTTERRYRDVQPVARETTLNGAYAVEIRGLWRVEGAHMGGPFISVSTYDKENGRIVTASGYVFAPEFNKRELLRTMEASIYTLRFPGNEEGA